MCRLVKVLSALACVVLIPAVANAQATIAGVVKDSSGAVLPGVTVEAASPALIEKVRTAVTDTTGQYRVVDLRPGTYTVTFTLTGFSSVKREGITIAGNQVATVDAELRVGAVTETITVTGEAPIVDVQSTRQQQVINKDVLEAIPTGRSHYHLAVLIPGMNTGVQDVGGTSGVQVTGSGSIHGASSGRLMNDGLTVGHNGESLNMWVSNVGGAQETVVSTSGGLGEAETGGVVINVVPREGSNTFHGSIFASGAGSGMQGSNYTADLQAKGLKTPNSIYQVFDFNPTFGGPVMKDKLWFFLTHRNVGARNYVAGMFENQNAGNPNVWTPLFDTSRKAIDSNRYETGSVRLTWQATTRNKFNVFWDDQHRCVSCGTYGGTATTTIEASGRSDAMPTRVYQATWQSPVTSRLLLDAGYGAYMQRWGNRPRNDGTYNPAIINVFELAGSIPGLSYRAPGGATTPAYGHHWTGIQSWRASLSYVTGAHAAKVGYFGGLQRPIQNEYGIPSGITNYTFLNGAPIRLTAAADRSYEGILVPNSFYAQDQWTIHRWTLQGGVRYDRMTSGAAGGDQVADPTIKAGPFFPVAISFKGSDIVEGHYNDITPRLGASYDVFGDGKTAVKVTLGKYMESLGAVSGGGFFWALNPLLRVALGANRAWTDSNKNFVPDCDLLNPAAQNLTARGGDICGPWDNQFFGTRTFTVTPDVDWFNGWGKRSYNWEFAANLQHELLPRVSVNVGYFRRWFGNFTVIDNRAVGPQDFDPFTLTLPSDARLPGGGGQTLNLSNIKPTKFGVFDNFLTAASNYGKMTRYWHGVDVTANVRLASVNVQGGVSTGREHRDECDIAKALPEASPSWAPAALTNPGNPSAQLYSTTAWCVFESPFQAQVKGLASYTIPKIDVLVSGTLQSIPGILAIQQTNANPVGIAANFNVPNATIRPALGRDLAGGVQTLFVNIVQPGTLYGDRTNQIDFRVAKVLRFGQRRLQVGVDVYNLTNTNAIQNYNQTFGGAWLTPTSILTARFAKISGQFDF